MMQTNQRHAMFQRVITDSRLSRILLLHFPAQPCIVLNREFSPITKQTPSIKDLKSAKKAITVKWEKQAAKLNGSHITGYQIRLATDKKFTKNKKTVTVKGYKTISKKIKNLKSKKKYYVKIRTYKSVGSEKNYSPWSKARSVKTH